MVFIIGLLVLSTLYIHVTLVKVKIALKICEKKTAYFQIPELKSISLSLTYVDLLCLETSFLLKPQSISLCWISVFWENIVMK